MTNWNSASTEAWNKSFGKDASLNTKLGAGAGLASSLLSMGTTATGLAKDNSEAMQNSVDNQIEQMKALGAKGIQATSMDDLMTQWANTRLLNGDYNEDDYYTGPSNGDIAKGTLSSTLNGVTTGLSVGGPWGALAGGIIGLGNGLIGGSIGKSKGEAAAKQAVADLKQQEAETNATIQAQLGLTADNMSNSFLRSSLANVAALGGPLFANGANWTNGLTMINAGGTHGQNPNGGVPMGISPDGLPNLVEEGEVVWNKYVFSNRINIPNELKKKYKFKDDDKLSFADAVKKIQKSSEERPNDPIERRTLDSILSEFMQSQETIRQKKLGQEERKLQKKLGGYLFSLGGLPSFEVDPNELPAGYVMTEIGVPMLASYVKSVDEYAIRPEESTTSTGSPTGFLDMYNATKPTSEFAPYAETSATKTPRAKAILAAGRPEGQEQARQYFNSTQDPKLFENATTPTEKSNEEPPKPDLPTEGWDENLRYVPAAGALGAIITDALGWTNKPDYQYADALTKAAEQYSQMPKISYKALGDYMTYNPFDRLFYANQLGAQQAATRRGILNLSNGNRGTAMAGLLSAGYNGNLGLGQLFRQGEEYNLAQRQKVAEFNRGTNMFNSEADLKTQMANAEMEKARNAMLMDAATKAALLKQQEDQASQAAKMANIKSFLTSLGNIGTEAYNRYDRNAWLNSGGAGVLNSSMNDRAK